MQRERERERERERYEEINDREQRALSSDYLWLAKWGANDERKKKAPIFGSKSEKGSFSFFWYFVMSNIWHFFFLRSKYMAFKNYTFKLKIKRELNDSLGVNLFPNDC